MDILNALPTLTLGAITGATLSGTITYFINKANRKNANLKIDLEDLKRIAYLASAILYLIQSGKSKTFRKNMGGLGSYRETEEFERLLQRLNEELGVNKYFRRDIKQYIGVEEAYQEVASIKDKVIAKIEELEKQVSK